MTQELALPRPVIPGFGASSRAFMKWLDVESVTQRNGEPNLLCQILGRRVQKEDERYRQDQETKRQLAGQLA